MECSSDVLSFVVGGDGWGRWANFKKVVGGVRIDECCLNEWAHRCCCSLCSLSESKSI